MEKEFSYGINANYILISFNYLLLHRPDGYIYNGSWLNGLQHGKGIEIDPEGKEREGEWENGKWKNWL